MKPEDEDETYKYLDTSKEAYLYGIDTPGFFDGSVKLSEHTIGIARELGDMHIVTPAEQTSFLLRTPDFANSIFADTAIESLNQDFYALPKLDAEYGLHDYKLQSDFRTYSGSQPGTTLLDTDFIVPYQDSSATLGARNISDILSTGIAIEGMIAGSNKNIDTKNFIAGEISPDPIGAMGLSQADMGVWEMTQSGFNAGLFKSTFQDIKTDFIIGHQSDIHERALSLLEAGVFEQKRSNDLKEKELELKRHEIELTKNSNQAISEMIQGFQDTLRLVSLPKASLELTKGLERKGLWLDPESCILSNSSKKSTVKISGQPLRLLKCLLDAPDFKCAQKAVLEAFRGKVNSHGGARRELQKLIEGVADIKSIHNADDKRKVDFYELIEI